MILNPLPLSFFYYRYKMSQSKEIEYSDKYQDDQYEYRHVFLPREIAKHLPDPPRLLSEAEWRGKFVILTSVSSIIFRSTYLTKRPYLILDTPIILST